MKSLNTSTGYVVRLEKGEELYATLEDFAREQKIKGAFLTGLGGLTQALIGYYNLERKKYVFRHVKGVKELVSLNGNIAKIGDSIALHLHGVVSDDRNKSYGGHIKEAICGGTIEIHIVTLDTELTRKPNPEIGLPLLEL